jgi:hypothetical protein
LDGNGNLLLAGLVAGPIWQIKFASNFTIYNYVMLGKSGIRGFPVPLDKNFVCNCHMKMCNIVSEFTCW